MVSPGHDQNNNGDYEYKDHDNISTDADDHDDDAVRDDYDDKATILKMTLIMTTMPMITMLKM